MHIRSLALLCLVSLLASPIKSYGHSVHGNTSGAPRPQVDLFDFPAWLRMDIQVDNPRRKGSHILNFTHKDVTYTLFNVGKEGFNFPASVVPKRLSNMRITLQKQETSEVKLGLYDRDQNGTFDLALIAEKVKKRRRIAPGQQGFHQWPWDLASHNRFQFQLAYQPRLLEGDGYKFFAASFENPASRAFLPNPSLSPRCDWPDLKAAL